MVVWRSIGLFLFSNEVCYTLDNKAKQRKELLLFEAYCLLLHQRPPDNYEENVLFGT